MIEAMLATAAPQDMGLLAVRAGTEIRAYNTDDFSLAAIVTSVPASGYPNAFKASPDGRYIASGSAAAPYLVIIDTATWEKVAAPAMPSAVMALDFTADSQYLLCGLGGMSSGVRRVSMETLALVDSPISAGTSQDIHCSPDGMYVAHNNGATLNLHDAITFELIRSVSVGNGYIYGLAFSPDSQYIAVTGDKYMRLVRVSDFAFGNSVVPRTDRGIQVRWYPNGNRFAVMGYSTTGLNLHFLRHTDLTIINDSAGAPAQATTGNLARSLDYSPTGDMFVATDLTTFSVWGGSDDPSPIPSHIVSPNASNISGSEFF